MTNFWIIKCPYCNRYIKPCLTGKPDLDTRSYRKPLTYRIILKCPKCLTELSDKDLEGIENEKE